MDNAYVPGGFRLPVERLQAGQFHREITTFICAPGEGPSLAPPSANSADHCAVKDERNFSWLEPPDLQSYTGVVHGQNVDRYANGSSTIRGGRGSYGG
jgi:hypothetical protein